MPALHVMTFNAELWPWTPDTYDKQGNIRPISVEEGDKRNKPSKIADAILALPKRPDVLALNGVWSGHAAGILASMLKDVWPHIAEVGAADDIARTGLMLFSRLPFLPFGASGDRQEQIFAERIGQYFKNGAGAVRIATPTEPTTIVFTNLQEGTSAETASVRKAQLAQLSEFLEILVAEDAGFFGRVVLTGDLVFRGDAPPGGQRPEWDQLVAAGSPPFDALDDGWNANMHPPGSPHPDARLDAGATAPNYPLDGTRSRADYMCFAKVGIADIILVPHHMSVGLRDQSAHVALEAIVQRTSAHCTPATAIDLLSIPPSPPVTQAEPSPSRTIPLNFAHDGTYQWIYVARRGTFTFWPAPGIEYRLFAQSDLSTPLDRLDTLNLEKVPGGAAGHREFETRGETFATREPFFVAVTRADGMPGNGQLRILEHLGDTPATAIGLLVHDTVEATFPSGQFLGAQDICWFKAFLSPTYAAVARSETFTVTNGSPDPYEATVHDVGGAPRVGPVPGGTGALPIQVETTGDEIILVSLRRSNPANSAFSLSWSSPVSYLLLDASLRFHIDDESGWDDFGVDEPELGIAIDAKAVFSGQWKNADTGDNWPNFDKHIRNRVNADFAGARSVGFVQSIMLGYVEPDMDAQGWQTALVGVLGPADPLSLTASVALPVPDIAEDGQYSLHYTLSKLPIHLRDY